MGKKFVVALASIALVFNSFMTPIVKASPQEDIKNSTLQIKQLDKQIVELKDKLSNLNAEINQLNDKLTKNKTEVDKTESKIKNTEQEIANKKISIEENQTILGNRLREMYKNDLCSNPMLLLLTSNSFSDFISNAQAVVKVISLDKKLISDLDEEKQTLQKNMDELNNKKNELKTLQESTKKSLSTIETKKNDQKKILDKLNKEKENAVSVIEKNENSLIAHSVSVINSSNSSESDIKDALYTLKALLPQLTTKSVKNKAQDAISSGTSKLKSIQASKKSHGSNFNLDRGTGIAKRTLQMEATAYCDGLVTATGLRPVRDASGLSTVAVDPSVIPLGSKLYIVGYGLAIAADTGSAIKNLKIDLYMNSSNECYAFGRRTVTVQILAYPGEW